MTSEEQLNRWLDGYPIHNHDIDECCPDFSCCQPQLLADKRTREIFCTSGDKVRQQLLILFLGKMIGFETDKKVYIAGDPDIGEQEH